MLSVKASAIARAGHSLSICTVKGKQNPHPQYNNVTQQQLSAPWLCRWVPNSAQHPGAQHSTQWELSEIRRKHTHPEMPIYFYVFLHHVPMC